MNLEDTRVCGMSTCYTMNTEVIFKEEWSQWVVYRRVILHGQYLVYSNEITFLYIKYNCESIPS